MILGVQSKATDQTNEIRTSIGFQSFLQNVTLPDWFPLANHQITGGQKVLNMLNLKKDHSGNVIWDENARNIDSYIPKRELIPMQSRTQFRVCVVGGGIAGLSCCLELLRECEKQKVNVEVILLEGQNRLGGRLWTDNETFKTVDNEIFPVELGASWIHGITDNPLAALAKGAGVDFVTTSEDVKMLQAGMKLVDAEKDEHSGQLFDKLLDFAVSKLANH